ncbi:unnamed protein product [Mycena citricolor]|uniref:ER-bound oxygenase mpaB/mpaB'/Rubber oxygenase catalytic domain-containing protein n=1 Tax=Mycena citricolor TaxID=2018698 RepID=A0AAD2HWF3_9AGAR|nr:unnamed protein product [Mycena citricolor]
MHIFMLCLAFVLTAMLLVSALHRTLRTRRSELDFTFHPGALMSVVGSTVALILQIHHPSISLALHNHSNFWERPLIRYLRTFIYVELALNGTNHEQEQTASWLRWVHRHIHGLVTEKTRADFGIPDGIEMYGYVDDLMVYVIQTLTWATIEFEERFGGELSPRMKDLIVWEYTCAAMRLGVPREMLSSSYTDFVSAFRARIDSLSTECKLTTNIFLSLEETILLSTRMRWITSLGLKAAFLVGPTLLPGELKSQYVLKSARSPVSRITQRVLCALLRLLYPLLLWLPLRGLIALVVFIEPGMTNVVSSTLRTIHSMDVMQDRPIPTSASEIEHVDYIEWLEHSGRIRPTFLQRAFISLLKYRAGSISLPGIVSSITGHATSAIRSSLLDMIEDSRCHLLGSRMKDAKASPLHVGMIMDGNRRFARRRKEQVIAGHRTGAVTASRVVEWWLRHRDIGPQYLTCWAFSSDNFARPAAERDGLFGLMTSEFKALAFSSVVHLYRIRITFIGSENARTKLPPTLVEAMELVEQVTRGYDSLFLQIAVGYGGREEIVDAVNSLHNRQERISEASISREMYGRGCGIPPVDLIVRTSEKRTSGFLLWDSQAAELHFIDKLWPELSELDWLQTLDAYAKREIRGGK